MRLPVRDSFSHTGCPFFNTPGLEATLYETSLQWHTACAMRYIPEATLDPMEDFFPFILGKFPVPFTVSVWFSPGYRGLLGGCRVLPT
jgi:hypothetical protein